MDWLLERGYQIHGKDISPARAENFAQAVKYWISDPKHPHRQMGWAEGHIDGYLRPVKRLILRWPPMKYEKWKKQPFHYACLLSTLEPQEVIRQLNLPVDTINNPDAVTLAYSTLYDQRGGTSWLSKNFLSALRLNRPSARRAEPPLSRLAQLC